MFCILNRFGLFLPVLLDVPHAVKIFLDDFTIAGPFENVAQAEHNLLWSVSCPGVLAFSPTELFSSDEFSRIFLASPKAPQAVRSRIFTTHKIFRPPERARQRVAGFNSEPI